MSVLHEDSEGCLAVSFIVIAILIILGGGFIQNFGTSQTITGTVERTYVKSDGGKKDKFYVVIRGSDGATHVFVNHDTMWHAKWNSAEVQARLMDGHCYTVRTVGFRIPFFSAFPNIVSVAEPFQP